jgi:hypothetical protein
LIPDSIRSSVMTAFRIPLNLGVVGVIITVSSLGPAIYLPLVLGILISGSHPQTKRSKPE